MLTQNVGQKEGRRGGWKMGRMSSKIRHISSLQACQLGPSVQVRGQNGNGHLSKEHTETWRISSTEMAFTEPNRNDSNVAVACRRRETSEEKHVTSTGIAISVQWCILHWVHLCTRKDSPLQLEHPKCRHLDVFDMIGLYLIIV